MLEQSLRCRSVLPTFATVSATSRPVFTTLLLIDAAERRRSPSAEADRNRDQRHAAHRRWSLGRAARQPVRHSGRPEVCLWQILLQKSARPTCSAMIVPAWTTSPSGDQLIA